MVTEKTILTISLEGDDIQTFKDLIGNTVKQKVGYLTNSHLSKDEVKLLDKLDKKLNKKKDE